MGDAQVHRWPAAALLGDIVRGAISFVGVLIVLLVVPAGSVGFFLALGFGVLVGWYLVNSLLRLRSVVEIHDDGLCPSGGLFAPKTIKWVQLERFELRYFSLKRDRTGGWMDLKLKGGGQAIEIDDRLDRFHDVLARAFDAARAADVGLSDTTHANLIAAGIIATPKGSS